MEDDLDEIGLGRHSASVRVINREGLTPTAEERDLAHRVAARYANAQVGVVHITDTSTGIYVRFHPFKLVAFTQSSSKVYFGFGQRVEFKCPCRAIQLFETPPAPVFPQQPPVGINLSFAAFLTDGTGIGSRDFIWSLPEIFESFYVPADSAFRVTIRSSSGTLVRSYTYNRRWSGSDYIPEIYYEAPSLSLIKFPIEVPNDACYERINPDTSFPANPFEDPELLAMKELWIADWIAAQVQALERERVRRRKCSDGRISILRNGILPPEFDYFVKRYHPRSLKLRRNIPMQVVSQTYSLISDVTTIEPTIRTRVYEGVVTLQYTNTVEDGVANQVIETFTGTLSHVLTTHTNTITESTTTSNTYTYNSFPMLRNPELGNTGDAFPILVAPNHPFAVAAFKEIDGSITRDNSLYPIFLEANGTVVQSGWHIDDKYATANYIHGEYSPPIPQSFDNVALTHPQFIYGYIETSKPIEFENIDGKKEPVTPSTDWLSSRLSDKEIITVIPLSFVTTEGDERGMFPYTTTPTASEYELFTQIKLYGFARFRFNYATSTFTFKDWTEFTTEGKVKVSDSIEHSFNDEINPTALTIGDKTYTLEPIVIDCEEDWLGTNCVFIGDITPWTDTNEAAKEQASHIGSSPPPDYELTAEERLYKAIREAIK